MKLEYVQATEAHSISIAARIRPADRMEIRSACGADALTGLEVSRRSSEFAFAIMAGDTPIAMIGVRRPSLIDDEGQVWMLAAQGVERHTRAFITDAPIWLAEMATAGGYSVFKNHVHADNVAHVRWLRRMGAVLGSAVAFGIAGDDFLPFQIEIAPCASSPQSPPS